MGPRPGSANNATKPAPDPLPTDAQRKALCEMFAYAFIEIRLLGWAGNAQRAADLADAFHEEPREMYGWGRWDRRSFRDDLKEYQRKYADDGTPPHLDFVSMLDAIFGPPAADEPLIRYWLDPWQPVAPTDAAPLEAELRRELSANHPLFGLPLTAIGRRSDADDVLFVIRQEPLRLAVVRLTWRGSAEADPQWPATEFFEGDRDWITRGMARDYAEWLRARK